MIENQTMPWLQSYENEQKIAFKLFLKELKLKGLTSETAGGLWHWGFYELDLKASQRLRSVIGKTTITEDFGFRKVNVVLLSDDTCHYVCDSLTSAGLKHGMFVRAGNEKLDTVYSSIAQNAELGKIVLTADFAVLWPNPKTGWLPKDSNHCGKSLIDEQLSRLSAIAIALEKIGIVPILATIPPKTNQSLNGSDILLNQSESWFRKNFNDRIIELAIMRSWPIWNLESLVSHIGSERFFDPLQYNWAKLAVSMKYTMRTADNIVSVIASLTGKTRRALILDLDNTLWGGTVGDDGNEQILIGQGNTVSEAFTSLQKIIIELKLRGILLAVCSKNTDAIAREPFINNPDMLLRLEDFNSFKANWKNKVENIISISKELRLGFSHLAFLDDNPAERSLVRKFLPEVAVIELDDDPAYFSRNLISCGFFEHGQLNFEDISRNQTIHANRRRYKLLEEASDYTQYLKSLNMEMELESFNGKSRSRISQLINKTNQFNLTTRRYNIKEIEYIESSNEFSSYQVRFRDKFSDYGIVSLVICKHQTDLWLIDIWLMSCRVLDRGLENAVFNQFVKICFSQGCVRLLGEYIPTQRNKIVSDLFINLGFEKIDLNLMNILLDKQNSKATYFVLDLAKYEERRHEILIKNAV